MSRRHLPVRILAGDRNVFTLDGTELYYHDQNQVIEVLDGSENVVRQIYPGTQYIDEAVAQRLPEGFAFVRQDGAIP